MSEQTGLAVYPRLKEFDSEVEFVEHVERVDGCTTKQLISSPRDITLTKDGRLAANGFRLTSLAFKQLCQFTAKGLYGLVADIGAVDINARSLDQFTSPALAADIINKVVELRFHVQDGISAKALILNADSKTVDGLVGARYRYVPHHQLYDSVKECMTTTSDIPVFKRGLVAGRRCAFTLASQQPHTTPSGYTLARCAYFTNSEAGEAGIHATAGIVIDDTYCAIDSAHMRHIAHSNSDFDARLTNLVSQTVRQYSGIALAGYGSRLEENLGVVVDRAVSKSVRKKLVGDVATAVGQALAEQVIRKAIFQGADRTTTPAQVSLVDIAQRTKRDLVILLCREGEGRNHTTREALEGAAFQIIV